MGVRESLARCINNNGQIAGAIRDSSDLVDAVVWNANLNSAIIAQAPFGAVATCINDRGKAVGYREDGIFSIIDQAFLWPAIDPNSAWTDLFDQNSESFATAINTLGWIVGSVDRQAFLRLPNGTVVFLAGDPNSGPSAMAVGVNKKGVVLVGQAGHAVLFTRNTQVTIPSPGPIMPANLNDAGEVVGYTQTSTPHGFVWDPKNGYSRLDDLVDTPGWRIFSGNSVNRDGFIAGYGIHNGRKRAVLLIPIKK